ncbi:SAM-dependent methyltransferase [Actinomadura scrupuli]|uniref:SAM-dependent methyltransferase n=1 Tax=Actinomadura scrupuli TaxID=559629 RepID=UPI003D971DDC
MAERKDRWWKTAAPKDWAVVGIDVNRPSIARVYDYLLGGKDNFASDRAVGDQIKQALPEIRIGVEAQRAVLRRVVRHLTAEAGVRQFIDIGSGLPTAGNVHETAQAIDPAARVVYVDHDPIVLAHAEALLTSDDGTIAINGELLRPEEILADPALAGHLDLTRPVGLLLCGILHHITDEENPSGLVARLRDALPSGSYVFIHHLIQVDDPGAAAAEAALRQGMGRGQFRPVKEVEQMFDGLELIDPGVVPVTEWRPEPGVPSSDDHPVLRLAVAGVARKP